MPGLFCQAGSKYALSSMGSLWCVALCLQDILLQVYFAAVSLKCLCITCDKREGDFQSSVAGTGIIHGKRHQEASPGDFSDDRL